MSGARVLMLLDNPCNPDMRVLREAAALSRTGAAVRIVCWDREGTAPEIEERPGIRIERIRTPSSRQLGIRQITRLAAFYRKAWRLLISTPFDVVHAHDFLMLPLGARLARHAGVPLIYDAHEIYHIMEADRYPRPVLDIIRSTERFLLRRSVNVFITVSEQRVTDYWNEVTGGREIFVVGNWYDPVAVAPEERRQARLALGVPDGALCVAYLGGLSRERRLDLLLEAAAQCPQVFIVVAGKGDPAIEQQLRNGATRLPNFRFLGWTAEPYRIYPAADALYYLLDPVHPYSQFAASNTLHIGIARGLPVITTPVGEPGAIMRAVDPALAIHPLDAGTLIKALTLLSNPAHMARIRAGMKGLQGRYNWRQAETTLLQAYGRTVKLRAD